MYQQDFAEAVVSHIKDDENIIGVAVAGSWISNEIDEFSDLDLLLITKEKVGGDKEKMLAYAKQLGDFISGFTGEHVGEPRVLICLYDNPLLHVDIKFLTLPEFYDRIENPVVLFERDGQLTKVMENTVAEWPGVDFQWIEDRFWTWIHYAALKIGRGELMETFDFLSFLRMVVFSPLMRVKNQQQPRGVRKVESNLNPSDLENLKITIAQYNKKSIVKAVDNSISVYRSLRRKLYPASVQLQSRAEEKAVAYFKEVSR